jgi:glutamyl-tRNA reductase
MQTSQSELSKFFIAGISYKKADAETRGLFAVSQEQYEKILTEAIGHLVDGLFIISTCNRTEIYGMAENEDQLIQLLCGHTVGDEKTFRELAYVKSGTDAVTHLFNVGAGLDSQILGDYEIVGQLKQAVKFSKDRGGINCFLERLVNSVLQASKEIKNETQLSSGSVSVSFSAVQYLRQHVECCHNKKILLFGIGKIGRNTCKNLVDYLGNTNITLINRSNEKAERLAVELGLAFAPMTDIACYLNSSDIILVATGATMPTVLKSHFRGDRKKLIIDLSIPNNVEPAVGELPGVQLINVDEISRLKDAIVSNREADIPKAKSIIADHAGTFFKWLEMRQHAPALNAIKNILNDIALLHIRELSNPDTKCPYIAAEQKIRQVVNKMAGKMKTQNQYGCHQIDAISEFIATLDF